MQKMGWVVGCRSCRLSGCGAHLSVVQCQRKGKVRSHYTGLSQQDNLKNFLRCCVSLFHFQSSPLAGAPAGIQLTEKENKPVVPRGFLAEYSTYEKRKKKHWKCKQNLCSRLHSKTIFGCRAVFVYLPVPSITTFTIFSFSFHNSWLRSCLGVFWPALRQ